VRNRRRPTEAKSDEPVTSDSLAEGGDAARSPFGNRILSIFERLSSEEMEALFDRTGDNVKVKQLIRDKTT
jgi:hypothetical protein